MNLQANVTALEYAERAIRKLLGSPDDMLFQTDLAVSEWSVAQHLHHTLKANGYAFRNILRIVAGEEDRHVIRDVEPRADTIVLLESGRIERGLAPAPAVVNPPDRPAREDLSRLMTFAAEKLDEVELLWPAADLKSAFVIHPLLGPLDGEMWLRFARIHTEHHLAIVEEVLEAGRH